MIGWSPTHDPFEPVSVEPTSGLPAIVGAEELAGTPLSVVTTEVAVDVAVVVPPFVVASTRKRARNPRSAEASWYVVFVAPAIAVQLFVELSSPASGLQRSQLYLYVIPEPDH